MRTVKVSIIISTYNAPDWLERTLWGFECQSTEGFEIVIADDGSGQETAQLIERFGSSQKFRIRHVRHDDYGFRKWKIVNRAIAEASGDYLIFTDGDCIPHPDLVATHRRLAEDGRYLSGGYLKLPMQTSRAIGEADIRSGHAFTAGWLRRHGFGFSLKWLKLVIPGTFLAPVLNFLTPAKRTFNGNNSSCFRKDALAVNGFDERILYGGGDREFGYRLEHAGILPKMIRYSTLCLHLDHPRGYKSAEVRAKNLALIEATRESRAVWTAHGIAATSGE
jgi:glycosyltransferase involved in cell wall biosynthesis